jgi:hypothetical protein
MKKFNLHWVPNALDMNRRLKDELFHMEFFQYYREFGRLISKMSSVGMNPGSFFLDYPCDSIWPIMR